VVGNKRLRDYVESLRTRRPSDDEMDASYKEIDFEEDYKDDPGVYDDDE
jgi:hypothetical protein